MASGICPFVSLVPGADWSENDQRIIAPRGATIHTTEGYGDGLISLGRDRHHNTPGTFQFLVMEDGRGFQFYPASVRCSHAAGSNYGTFGIEQEGRTGEARPPAQLATLGRILGWGEATFGYPLDYHEADPRVWVDQVVSYRGCIAHRGVDYPPDHSLLHFDGITGPEFLTATLGSPVPVPPPMEAPDMVQMFLDRQTVFVDDVGHLRHAYWEGGKPGVEVLNDQCVPNAAVAVRDEATTTNGTPGYGPGGRDVWIAAPLKDGTVLYAVLVPNGTGGWKWNFYA